MLKCSSASARNASASWPSGSSTAVMRRRIILRRSRQRFSRPQALHGAAGRFGEPVVAGEHVVEAFLVQHVDRRRPGRAASASPACRGRSRLLFMLSMSSQAQNDFGSFEVLVAAMRLVADRVERHAGRQHQALLRAADGDVDAPFVVAVVGRGERGDGVDHEQRRMAGGVDRLADLGDRRQRSRSRSRCAGRRPP